MKCFIGFIEYGIAKECISERGGDPYKWWVEGAGGVVDEVRVSTNTGFVFSA